jgi:hypothetical protein
LVTFQYAFGGHLTLLSYLAFIWWPSHIGGILACLWWPSHIAEQSGIRLMATSYILVSIHSGIHGIDTPVSASPCEGVSQHTVTASATGAPLIGVQVVVLGTAGANMDDDCAFLASLPVHLASALDGADALCACLSLVRRSASCA